MWGTIAKMQVKPGMEPFLLGQFQAIRTARMEGWQRTSILRSATNPNELWMIAFFDSEEHYKQNAASPAQHALYLTLRSALEADPEWHDISELITHTAEHPEQHR